MRRAAAVVLAALAVAVLVRSSPSRPTPPVARALAAVSRICQATPFSARCDCCRPPSGSARHG